MWSHLIKLVSLSKGALVVGVAASAAMVSNAEFSNAPSHQELPSASPAVISAPPSTTRPANSPSSLASPKVSTVPAVQLPSSSSPASPKTEPGTTSGLQHGEIPQVVKDCVDKYLAIREQGDSAPAADRQAVGELCKAALAATGLSSQDFWAKFGLDKHTTSGKTEPNTTSDLEAQIHECVSQYLAGTADGSDACRHAIAASGLTPQEFWTKFGPHADKAKGELSPEALAMAHECVTKYNAKSTDSSTTCKKAIELSGLTSAEFAAKFFPRTTETKPTPTTAPRTTVNTETYALITKCLQLYAAISTTGDTKSVSEACGAAIKSSGMSSSDFWATYHPTTKTEPTASPKPVTNTAELSQLVPKCLDLYKAITSTGDTHAASEACGAAIRASGLSSADFWAKYHPTTN